MTDLFGQYVPVPMKQRPMFDMSGPRESDECCAECSRPLVETVSGYWTCPAGCGRLLIRENTGNHGV